MGILSPIPECPHLQSWNRTFPTPSFPPDHYCYYCCCCSTSQMLKLPHLFNIFHFCPRGDTTHQNRSLLIRKIPLFQRQISTSQLWTFKFVPTTLVLWVSFSPIPECPHLQCWNHTLPTPSVHRTIVNNNIVVPPRKLKFPRLFNIFHFCSRGDTIH